MSDLQRYMAICSEKTLQSNTKGFFLQFADAVQEAAGKEWIRKVFGKLKSDHERIRIIYHDPKVKDIVLTTLSHVQEIYRKKSAEVSLARRFDAQKAFHNDELNTALMLLSQAVLRAPKTGENRVIDGGLSLCQGLWARSEVLMRLNKYDLALHDVQFAMKEGLPVEHKAEAFWRMAICYKVTKEDKKSNVSRNLALNLLKNNEKVRKLLDNSLTKEYQIDVNQYKMRRRLSNLKESATFKGASHKVNVVEAPGKGRFTVAKEDLQTGELIIQEDAYASCLLPEYFGTHCHHCYDRLESPVGCWDCSSIAFCSIECRDIALNTYHKHECHFLDLLIGSGMSILAHVALRIVTQSPIEYLLERHKEMDEGTANGAYDLCTLREFRNPDDFLQRTVMAGFLLRCLQKCGYFGYVDDKVIPNENQFKIGEILLYNLQMLQFNAHEIYETRLTKAHHFDGAVANYIGVAVYPTAALMNHDCNPSVLRYFVGKHIVLRATQPIKTGQEIADNYGPYYSRKTLQERQKYLKGRYWFECKCTACIQNWPLIDVLETISPRVMCPYNAASQSDGAIQCDYFFTLPIKNKKGKCPRCKNNVNLGPAVDEYQRIDMLYWQALNCMDQEKVKEGIVKCCEGLDAFYKISAPPHKITQLVAEALRGLYADSGNMWEKPTVPTKNINVAKLVVQPAITATPVSPAVSSVPVTAPKVSAPTATQSQTQNSQNQKNGKNKSKKKPNEHKN